MVVKYDIVRITATVHESPIWSRPRRNMDQYVNDGRDYMVLSILQGGNGENRITLVELDRHERYAFGSGYIWPESALTVTEPYADQEKVIVVYKYARLPRRDHSGFSSGTRDFGLAILPLKYVESGLQGTPIMGNRNDTEEYIPLRSIMTFRDGRMIDHRLGEAVPDPQPDEADDVDLDDFEDEEDDL